MLPLVVGLLCSTAVQAAEISLLGLFSGKAMLVVDGAAPKTYKVGENLADGSKLVAVGDGFVTVEENRKRYTIALGQYVGRSGAGGQQKISLAPDERGHYMTNGQINGQPARMMVDTGATMVVLPAADAVRMGIDYKKGGRGFSNTANGPVPVYVVRLDRVRVGEVELNQIEGMVQESGLPIILLGNSFLNRFDLQREGGQLTLTKRY
ncbi:MAG: TIGR02281 family clan AA aspartic protease [Pseudomonadota bacterium]